METSQSQSSIDNTGVPLPKKDNNNILQLEFLGYKIFVGRNAGSNESLVKNHPHRDCLWMHVIGCKGAHLVLCQHEKPAAPDIVLRRAAALAIQYSKGTSKQVVYAPLLEVYKPQNDQLGVWKTWGKNTIGL